MSEYYYEKQKDLNKLVAEYEHEDSERTKKRNTARNRIMNQMSEFAIQSIEDTEFAKSTRGTDAPTDQDLWFRMFNYTYIYYQNMEKKLIAKYAAIYDPTTKYTINPMPSLIDAWREPVRPIRSRAFHTHIDPCRHGR